MTVYHPLRTVDGRRLPLTAEQPPSGIPSAFQTTFTRPVIAIIARHGSAEGA